MKKETSPYFKCLIEHINASWIIRKQFSYPFAGRDFRELKNLSRIFKEWGVMALWDVFVNSENDWVKKSGYSINAFTRCVPWLVDAPGWKEQASRYELQVAGEYPKEISDLFNCLKVAV